MDTVLINNIDMANHIEMISFEEGPPLYLKEYNPSFSLVDKRLTLENLHNLYDMFDSNSSGGELLDSLTSRMVCSLSSGELFHLKSLSL
jgi:hypothetical protein